MKRNFSNIAISFIVSVFMISLFFTTESFARESTHQEEVVGIQANNCNAPTPNGFFWIGNPPIGLLCSNGMYPPVFVSYFDKAIGTVLHICPGQFVPSNWSVTGNTTPAPTWCGTYSINGTKWIVVRTS